LKKTLNNIFKLLILTLLLSFAFSPVALAKEAAKVDPNKWDASYFPAIEGEVQGQALQGVESVQVNNQAVLLDKDLTFKTEVKLEKGQKYLVIKTQYKGIVFVKKYLIVRHPGITKPFKIKLAQNDFHSLVKKVIPSKIKMTQLEKSVPKIPVKPKIMEKWVGFELVAELEPGQLLIVEKQGDRYFGYIYSVKEMVWVSIQEISYLEFKELLDKGLIPSSFARKTSS